FASVKNRASASPIDFWRSAGTALRASRSRSVPPIMATSFMTNADYLDDRRYVRANRYPARRPQLLSKGEFCHVAKFASRAFGARRGCNNLHIQLLNCQFWQNEAKMINVFKGSHLLPTPTCASCD